MPGIVIKMEDLNLTVSNLIFDKQNEYKKAGAGRHYSLQRTINRLLKEAYVDKSVSIQQFSNEKQKAGDQ